MQGIKETPFLGNETSFPLNHHRRPHPFQVMAAQLDQMLFSLSSHNETFNGLESPTQYINCSHYKKMHSYLQQHYFFFFLFFDYTLNAHETFLLEVFF